MKKACSVKQTTVAAISWRCRDSAGWSHILACTRAISRNSRVSPGTMMRKLMGKDALRAISMVQFRSRQGIMSAVMAAALRQMHDESTTVQLTTVSVLSMHGI